ncbi:phage tail protein [Lactobacillus reuteri]|uniref:Phage tail protein n=1 Tax=Limosilactobacillus reuteri TaxID=1598 RepID=A0AAW9ZG40_LIMRT|nr:phage tail protein [Limosilactobacillus reuteri]NME21799.1 phage tail protein [Limosilactobacillus reuteri]
MAETIVNGLDDALDLFVKQLEKSTKLNVVEKQTITQAGGAVFRDHLREETSAKHRSNHNDKTWGHAADNIDMYSPRGNSSKYGTLFGDTLVGWKNRYHAMNMERLNDGTRFIKADHFVTNLRNDPTVRSEILAAEKAAYSKIMQQHENKEGD